MADEFNGSSIDTTKWGYGQLPWGGNHHNSSYASSIVAANSYLDSGNLVLGVRPGSFPASDGTTQPYTSGMVYSQGKFEYAYGYAEVTFSMGCRTPGKWRSLAASAIPVPTTRMAMATTTPRNLRPARRRTTAAPPSKSAEP